MLKENKGITLVALVITIIVLLILAGVSLAMISGNEGILTKANEAKTKNHVASLSDAANLAVAEILMNKNGLSTTATDKLYSADNIVALTAANLNVKATEIKVADATDSDAEVAEKFSLEYNTAKVYITVEIDDGKATASVSFDS